MKKLIILLLIAISTQAFSQEYFAFGYKTLNSSTLPSGWSQEYVAGDGTAAWYGYGGLYTPYEGSGNWYFNVWDAVGNHIGDEAMIITEAFSNDGIDNSFIGFWHHQVDFGGDNNELEVYYRTSATASWVLLQAFPDAIEDWTEEQLFFPEQSATMQVGFKGILTGGDNTQGVALDYIFTQYYTSLCFTPSNFEVETVTSTTASISWEEIGSSTTWNIEYGAHGYTQGTGTAINGINTTPEHTITGLTANTHYDVYVQSDCGSGEFSDWAGEISFYTNCNTVTTFPYLEAFNNENIDGNDWNDPLRVNCWTENVGQIANPTVFTGADSDWSPREFGNEQSYNPDNANSLSARFFGVQTWAWLFSPIIDLGTSNNKQLEFDIALANSSNSAISLENNDTIAVVISTDGGATWNKSDILLHWDATTNASEITPTGIHQIVDLSTYTGEVQIAFYENGGSFGYIYIDNVKIIEVPTTPVLELLEPFVWNAGPQIINETVNSGQIFTIRNSGINTLSINSISDLSATEFTTDFNISTTLNEGEEYSFSFTYAPTDLVNDVVSFEIVTDFGTETITLNGEAYELATCEIEIGTDNQEVDLPANMFYNHSFSQSIFLQSEINRINEDFRKIYFYYNGYDDFTNQREFTIYMKHSSLTEFTTWEDINTFAEVATATVDFTTEGWYEIDFDIDFAYNNTDNIVIGVSTTVVSATTVSQQNMYAHDAPNGDLMSIVTYSSAPLDLESLPGVSPIAYRPNVRFCLENTTNIINVSSQNQPTIYPNPATTQLNIKNINSSINTIEILDVTGKIVLLRNIKSLNTNSINISKLNKGIYFVKIGTEVQKFIKE